MCQGPEDFTMSSEERDAQCDTFTTDNNTSKSVICFETKILYQRAPLLLRAISQALVLNLVN